MVDLVDLARDKSEQERIKRIIYGDTTRAGTYALAEQPASFIYRSTLLETAVVWSRKVLRLGL
ncbi:MAG TPA: hypothetical protein VJI12_04790 [archaeon]|nr:hypothetical protein [archaeon]